MHVICENCQSGFYLKDALVKRAGSKVRCSKCQHVFVVYPLESGIAQYPRKTYTPFRTKLIYFASALIGFIAAIVIPLELYRPVMHLKQLIGSARNLIAGVQAAIDPTELERMNEFAFYMIENSEIGGETDDIPEIYYGIAFNMLLIHGTLLPERTILTNQELMTDEFSEEAFNYSKLIRAGEYWETQFTAYPGILDILKKYKIILMKAKQNARSAGFPINEIMIMADTGRKDGFFKDHIAYIIESSQWWKLPTYIGQAYPVSEELEFWRKSALNGEEGYGNNPVSDPDNWYLPKFDEDEWGTWFSVWMTQKTSGVFNIISLDVNARDVKRMLIMLAGSGVVVISILLTMVIVITQRLSRLITRPITELIKGSEEVAKGNYSYQVPVLKDDEFGELTRQFNLMTQGQKERLNLMETLEKFLSKELAEKAAKSGLVLGGQKTNCTVMFTDFAGFSTITQQMTPVETVHILNAYYNGLIPIIKKYGGFPDKYIGDAIVALFGAPVRLEDHAERAVACAIEMQRKMREINQKRLLNGKMVFEMRIGLNSGDVIVGAIGCDMKLEYTSIGETTNLASRMESVCEIGHIALAEGTFRQIRHIFFKGVDIEPTPQNVPIKGYPYPVSTYRIYVDNLEIEKNPGGESFYRYTTVDHKIKFRPEEVRDGHIRKVSAYLV